MVYDLAAAIKDEIKLLDELQVWAEERRDRPILAGIYREIASSHKRIIRRYEDGDDFVLEVNSKKVTELATIKSARKTLKEEYPVLKDMAEKYNLMEKLISSGPDD